MAAPKKKLCSVKGCKKPVRTKGKCASCYATAWNRSNRDKYNKNWRKHYTNNAESRRLTERKRALAKYGLTLAEYDRLLLEQRGLCAICSRRERNRLKHGGVLRSLAVDHDHITGQVRGLLCSSCNRGLGKFGDDSTLLRAAARYLETHTCQKNELYAQTDLPRKITESSPASLSTAQQEWLGI